MKDSYFESEEFKEILERYESSRKQGYTCYLDVDDYVDIADYYLGVARADDGIDVTDAGLDAHPGNELLLSVKSSILIYMHDYEGARQIVDGLVELSDDKDVFYQKAQLKYALDKDEETAEEMFREWISYIEKEEDDLGNSPTSEYVRESYVHVITSFIELSDNRVYDPELVKRWVEEYIVVFEPLGEYNSDLILADIVRDEFMSDMIEKVYSQILVNAPYANFGWTVLATAQNINGKFRESIESCDFALAVNPDDWDAKITKAQDYYALEDYDKALPLFEEVMNKFSDNSQSLPYAECLLYCNHIDEGREQLYRALEFVETIKDKDKTFYVNQLYNISQGCLLCDDIELGRKVVDMALEEVPSDVSFLLNKGIFLLMDGDYEKSLSSFLDALSNSSDYVSTCISVVLRLIYKNYDKLALDLLDGCVNIKSDSPSVRLISAYKAYIYYRLRDYQNFMVELETAHNECPEMIESLFADVLPPTLSRDKYYDYLVNNPF